MKHLLMKALVHRSPPSSVSGQWSVVCGLFHPAAHSLQPSARIQQSGFTLIELLVVMVVAVTLMVVSLPAFLSIGRGIGMRTAVNNVRSTISLSRQWAITHREQITFVAMNNLEYQDDTGALVTNPAYCATNNQADVIQRGTPLPFDVTFRPPGGDVVTRLTFKTDGGLAGGIGTVKIILVDEKSKLSSDPIETTISINGLTGGITVEE